MGSFNVACSVSKISISCGTDVVYFPLEVSKYPYKIGDGNNTLIYPWCFYSPATLPIFGKYDDYGGVEDIIRDKNVEYIEDYFKCKIDDITGIDNRPEPISAGMFVHRKIYDLMINLDLSDYNGKKEIFKKELSSQYDDFKQQLIDAKKEMIESNNLWKENGREDKIRHDEFKWVKEDWHCFNFRDFGIFPKIYKPCIFNGLFRDELIDIIMFNRAMFDTNSFYFQAMAGPQFGNNWASKELYKQSLKVVIKDIIDYRINDLMRNKWWEMKYRIKKFLKKLLGENK